MPSPDVLSECSGHASKCFRVDLHTKVHYLHLVGNSSSQGCQHLYGDILPVRCILTADQLRAARAMLRMDQSALAVASGVSVETIKRLEGMKGELSETRVATINAIQAALEKAGVTFIAENGGGPGVRLKKIAKGVEEISQEIDALEDKISSMPARTELSPEAGMNIMRKAVAKNDLAKLKNRRTRITRPDRTK
jgi:transcriptional regulator with XRE-family HTH domain